ncbi:MAG: hypothetical protein F6K50_42450, partial [Moorea sp. SIO3I7]|nr:hypothetical protein [Moorena sp. SIO3I7]
SCSEGWQGLCLYSRESLGKEYRFVLINVVGDLSRSGSVLEKKRVLRVV